MVYKTKILRVAVPSPLRRAFDYLPPHGSSEEQFQPGQRIRVPFGPREIVGILLSVEQQTAIEPDKLKNAVKRLDNEPPIPQNLFKLCQWASHYYHHPIGEVFANAIPSLMRQGESTADQHHWCWKITPAGLNVNESSLKNAPRQAEALATLGQHSDGLTEPALKSLGIKSLQLNALQRKGFAAKFIRPEQPLPHDHQSTLKEAPFHLNEEQQSSIEPIFCAIDQQQPQTFLLHGVTGSGKTEIYLQLIARCLQQQQQALVLVPEIGLTPQTLNRFENRFNCRIAALHSGLSERVRFENWINAQKGKAEIIIGTRSAIFTPLIRPGLIIIDEEHDSSYKQQEGFRYSARDLAMVRAKIERIPIVLGSATPALESLNNALQGRYQYLSLTQRVANKKLPTPKRVDMRNKKLHQGISEPVLQAIENHLKQNNQALIFVNRRGYAPVLMCHACGWNHQCRRCDTAMTLHQEPPLMICHHCSYSKPIPRRCPSCGNEKLQTLGYGTEKIENFLLDRFNQYDVIRVDRDSTRGKSGWENKLKQIHQDKPAILLGTQMLAKGHHFPNVSLAVIIDADGGLFSVDFRAPERLAQLIGDRANQIRGDSSERLN